MGADAEADARADVAGVGRLPPLSREVPIGYPIPFPSPGRALLRGILYIYQPPVYLSIPGISSFTSPPPSPPQLRPPCRAQERFLRTVGALPTVAIYGTTDSSLPRATLFDQAEAHPRVRTRLLVHRSGRQVWLSSRALRGHQGHQRELDTGDQDRPDDCRREKGTPQLRSSTCVERLYAQDGSLCIVELSRECTLVGTKATVR